MTPDSGMLGGRSVGETLAALSKLATDRGRTVGDLLEAALNPAAESSQWLGPRALEIASVVSDLMSRATTPCPRCGLPTVAGSCEWCGLESK